MHVVVLIILVCHNCCVPDTISNDHLTGVLNFMVTVSATHTKQFCDCFSVQLFCGEDCRWVLLHTDLCSSLAHTAIQWLHFVTPRGKTFQGEGQFSVLQAESRNWKLISSKEVIKTISRIQKTNTNQCGSYLVSDYCCKISLLVKAWPSCTSWEYWIFTIGGSFTSTETRLQERKMFSFGHCPKRGGICNFIVDL